MDFNDSVVVPTIQMLKNTHASVPELGTMVGVVVQILGVLLVVLSVMDLKATGDGQHGKGKAAAVKFLIGSILLTAPDMWVMVIESVFPKGFQQHTDIRSTNFQYGDKTVDSADAQMAMQAFLMWIQLVGMIAFAKGWIMLSKTDSQDGSVMSSKAWTHIIGGAAAINIVGSLKAVQSIFGFSFIS